MESKKIEVYFFLGLLLIVLGVFINVLYSFLNPILFGLTFAVIFAPVYRKIRKAFRGSEGLAAMATVILILLIVVTPVSLFSIRVFQEASQAYSVQVAGAGAEANGNLQSRINEIADRILPDEARRILPEIRIDGREYLKQFFAWLAQNAGAIFSSLASGMFEFVLALFALYYFLKDGHRLRKAIIDFSPLGEENNQGILDKLAATVNSVIKGTLAVALAQGLVAGIGFAIFGLPNPALWGSVTVIASLIPTIGTALVVVPATLYMLLVGNTLGAIGLAAWGFLIVGLVDNFLRPLLIERGIKIHPFLILLSVLGGLNLFGPVGFLLGPLVLSLLFSLFHIYPTIVYQSERS